MGFFSYFSGTSVGKYLFYLYVRLLFSTYRIRVDDVSDGEIPLYKRSGICIFTYSDIVKGLFFLSQENIRGHIVCDMTPEGELLAYVAQKCGLRVVRNTGKISFIREVLEILELNKRIFIVEPFEERRSLQRRNAYLAARSGVPLIYISCGSSSSIKIPFLWHGANVPLPWGSLRIILHAPRYFVLDRKDKTITECGGPAPEEERDDDDSYDSYE